MPRSCLIIKIFLLRDRSRSSLPVRQSPAAAAVSRTASSISKQSPPPAGRQGRPLVAAILVARPSGLLGRRPPQVREAEEGHRTQEAARETSAAHAPGSGGDKNVGLGQRTAEWVRSIRGDEGSGLTADRKLLQTGPRGRDSVTAFKQRGGDGIAGGPELQKQRAGEVEIGPPSPGLPTHEQSYQEVSITLSFKSCDSPKTAASVESLLADDAGSSGGGKRWPSASRIPLLVSVTSAREVTADSRRAPGPPAGTRKRSEESDSEARRGKTCALTNNSCVKGDSGPPERGVVVADRAVWSPLSSSCFSAVHNKNALAAIGRLRVRSESPSR